MGTARIGPSPRVGGHLGVMGFVVMVAGMACPMPWCGSVVVDVGDVLFEHAAQVACPWHLMLLRQRCAGCDAPLRLAAGREGCGQCGAAIAAMATRSLAGDADGREVSALVWRATGCGEGPYPPEGLTQAADHLVRELGTPALLRGLWGGAQAEGAGEGMPRLHEREIAEVHEALVAGWRRLRDESGPGLELRSPNGPDVFDSATTRRAGDA